MAIYEAHHSGQQISADKQFHQAFDHTGTLQFYDLLLKPTLNFVWIDSSLIMAII